MSNPGFDIIPYLPFAGVVVGGAIVGAVRIWNRRHGAVEAKAPTVAQSWAQADAANRERDIERDVRRQWQGAFYRLRDVFYTVLGRARSGGSLELTDREQAALDFTATIDKEKK